MRQPIRRYFSALIALLLVPALSACSRPAAPGESGGSISFIEPDYYPDYDEKDDTSEAPVIRDDSDTAPKTADAPILPTLLLAALSALVLVRAKKRLCR